MIEPTEEELFQIYLEMEYDTFAPFGGLTGEGRELARREWSRRHFKPDYE